MAGQKISIVKVGWANKLVTLAILIFCPVPEKLG
jgi:hypothetical protein